MHETTKHCNLSHTQHTNLTQSLIPPQTHFFHLSQRFSSFNSPKNWKPHNIWGAGGWCRKTATPPALGKGAGAKRLLKFYCDWIWLEKTRTYHTITLETKKHFRHTEHWHFKIKKITSTQHLLKHICNLKRFKKSFLVHSAYTRHTFIVLTDNLNWMFVSQVTGLAVN